MHVLRSGVILARISVIVVSLLITPWLSAQTTAPASEPVATAPATPLRFSVTYDPSITSSYTGRVYVMLSQHKMGEPRLGPSWTSSDPFFAVDVKNWKPGTPLVVDDHAEGYPAPGKVSAVVEKEYLIQAVMRRNIDSPDVGNAEGDAYSTVIRQKVSGASAGNIELRIDQLVGPPSDRERFHETDRLKLVEMRSKLLSDFFHRDIIMRAAVVLPKDYTQHADWKYPALYWIGGFGSDYREAQFMMGGWESTGFSASVMRIVLDPRCYGGHHVFADSENNGPRGQALVEELIPYIESKFRLAADSDARFLSGHSSGGWSSLWLQVAYPDFFGGVWSLAPDPIDFRDFQRINIYKPGTSMYIDENGERRPLARMGGRVTIWYDNFARMDSVMGEGGQLRSFEWVFSHRGTDGKPEPLYDRETGVVDPTVAESWKRYDIRMIVEDHWDTLGPKLNDGAKLRVFSGELDTFYLEGAARLFKQSMATLNSKAVVEIVPGKDHGSVASTQLRKRIDEELLAVFEKHHPDQIRPRAYD